MAGEASVEVMIPQGQAPVTTGTSGEKSRIGEGSWNAYAPWKSDIGISMKSLKDLDQDDEHFEVCTNLNKEIFCLNTKLLQKKKFLRSLKFVKIFVF